MWWKGQPILFLIYLKKPEETFTKIKSCIGGDKFDQVAHVMNEMNPW